MKIKKLKKGQAYREYLSVHEEVNRLIIAGFNLVEIYELLAHEKKISMSYQSLYYNHCSRGKKAGSIRSNQKNVAVIKAQTAKPAGKILSLDEIVSEKKAELRNFSEQQLLSNEELEGHKNQIDLLVGQEN